MPLLNLLHLNGNKLTGGIPKELGSLSNLARLEAGKQPVISGSIPKELGNLARAGS